MKLTTLLLFISILSSCEQEKYEIEQSISNLSGDLVTCVWDGADLIRCWYDPIETVDSELVIHRQAQADSLIAALKLMQQ